MGHCVWCGRTGLLLAIDKDGLCPNCSPFIRMDIQNRIRILNDSLKLIKETKKIETLISRLDLVIEQSQELMKYEKKGISTTNPLPSKFYQEFTANHDSIILEKLKNEYDNLIKTIEIPSVSAKKRINYYNKLLVIAAEIKLKLYDPENIEDFENKIKSNIHKIQLDSLLEEAEKAEFKNNKKMALNKYYDALYFLQHDDIEDSLQNEQISKIKKKIIEFGGTLK